MKFSLSRWKPRHLAAAWAAWWLGLGVVTLTKPLLEIWRLTHLPPDQAARGEISFGFSNTLMTLSMGEGGVTTYNGSVHLLTVVALIAVPPLVLFITWLSQRPRPGKAAAPAALGPPAAQPIGSSEVRKDMAGVRAKDR
jgi:hypothetical protein